MDRGRYLSPILCKFVSDQKLPAFRLYPADFIVGTATMDAASIGGYILLLCYQWDAGSIPDDKKECATIAKLSVAKVSALIYAKFQQGIDSKFRNERLERERTKATEFSSKQAQNGKLGAENRWHRHNLAMASPQPKHGKSVSVSESLEERETGDVEFCLPPGFPKSATEAQACIGNIGCSAEFAGDTWQKAFGRGGHDSKDIPIRNWSGYLAMEWKFERNRIAEKAQKSIKSTYPAGSGTADKIAWNQERERIKERLAIIRGQGSQVAGGGIIYDEKQKSERKKLKGRDEQLKQFLGVVI